MAKHLQPTMATSNPALSTTNLLHELDASAQEVIGKVAAAQVSALDGPCELLIGVLTARVAENCLHVVMAAYTSQGRSGQRGVLQKLQKACSKGTGPYTTPQPLLCGTGMSV